LKLARNADKGLSVQERVYLSLRKKIMDFSMLPGTVMSANEISGMMQVSRTPVREAFVRLEREGLVNIVPQSETTVSRIDLKRAWQEQFLRESLELAALERFFQKCSREHLAKLRKIIQVQHEKLMIADYAAFIDFDDAFHRLIFIVSEQPLCWEIIESMSGHYRRIRLLTLWSGELNANVVAQHEELVDEIEKGDFPKVKLIIENHLRKLYGEEEMLLRNYPDYFKPSERDPLEI